MAGFLLGATPPGGACTVSEGMRVDPPVEAAAAPVDGAIDLAGMLAVAGAFVAVGAADALVLPREELAGAAVDTVVAEGRRRPVALGCTRRDTGTCCCCSGGAGAWAATGARSTGSSLVMAGVAQGAGAAAAARRRLEMRSSRCRSTAACATIVASSAATCCRRGMGGGARAQECMGLSCSLFFLSLPAKHLHRRGGALCGLVGVALAAHSPLEHVCEEALEAVNAVGRSSDGAQRA